MVEYYRSKFTGKQVEDHLDSIKDKQDKIEDLDEIRSNASKGASALRESDVAKVATSGSYNDLMDKPTIPDAVTESTVKEWGFTKNEGTYVKPMLGIPESDLSKEVQASLDKANSALQEHQDISGKQDALVSGKNIKTINGYSILGQGNLNVGGGGGEVGYSAKISLVTPQFNAVLEGSSGHYIEFAFDTTNGAGDSMGEGVTCTYTITRGTNQTVVTEKYRYNTKVRFAVDKFLQEGANNIVINIVGDISGLSTSIGVTFQVINLVLDANYDVSKVYDLSNKSYAIVEVPFTLSGYGTKLMEWYLDGEALDFVKNDDEVVDVTATRTKYITISNLSQGTHSLQVRAYTMVNGELFYTDTQYYDLIVYTGANQELIIGASATIPMKYGVLGAKDKLKIYDAVQYKTYTLRFATYSPTSASSTEVSVVIDGDIAGAVSSVNGVQNEFRYTPVTHGNKTLTLRAGAKEYVIPMVVEKTSMNIDEITTSLALDFNAGGRTNNSSNKDSWSFGNYVGTFVGFDWNNTSGWVDGRLEMNAGASLAINYAPLAVEPTKAGKTIEIEWKTKKVTNDDAVICDLRGDDGVGILITATKVHMRSADGVVVETEYKSGENVRVGFVINQSEGVANQRLSFIYANGIVSRGEQWSATDSYISDKEIIFTATEEAEISLKSIRIYDTALTSDQMLNNYILYRDTLEEMLSVYDRNDIYVDGTTTFSPDKMASRLPVMIVTGDIPTLENTSDKDTQIIVDIEYRNLQNPNLSFTMTGAAMRPQGTSSMGYPKKNFRIYTKKVDDTVLYGADGKVVEDKLYSFTDKAQPVDCWCLKADYAESSGTHNTGIARLWNKALMNAQVGGEYVCRTGAQKAAIDAEYKYDVRTTIDGFPILLFYRPTKNDDLIFIGKYNFNNDKSTESVFGFKGIPNFNNEKMQCWEILNNGNALALFTSVEGFDEGWSEAFESRYPDTNAPYTGDLKSFCEWMTNVSQESFATEKWEHLNVYMMAAYWCYLMRHAGADQFVKNAMFTSEDGVKWYFILYDNDTINGLINTGRLRIKPTDDRQTMDESGAYVFAGHDSRLWNMLEADEEFNRIVSDVDNALYSAGISYQNTIKIFDEEQADKWVEKVYNQDAQYKYVAPFVERGVDNLFMLQGKRDLHRKWWLAKRFSIYDAKYVSGTYKAQAVELKCINGTPAGQKITVKSGYPLDYGYGINDVPRESGVALNTGDSHTFITREVVNLGDPIRVYGAPNIAELDLSEMTPRLAVVNIAGVYDNALGTKLVKLVLGKSGSLNYEVTTISGLKSASSLEHLDIQGMTKLSSVDLTNHEYFKTLKAYGSGISSVSFAKGAPVERLELPATMKSLVLEQLPLLSASNLVLEDIAGIHTINIKNCPNMSNDFSWVKNWYDNKTTTNSRCTLIMDNVNWTGVDPNKLLELVNIGELNLKGRVELTEVDDEIVDKLMDAFGETAFSKDSDFYLVAPSSIFLYGRTSILIGESEQYTAVVFGGDVKRVSYGIASISTSNSHVVSTTKISPEGLLTTVEGTYNSDYTVTVRVTAITTEGTLIKEVVISVAKRVYPTLSVTTITGDGTIYEDVARYQLTFASDNVNGDYAVTWSLEGLDDYAVIESSDDASCVIRVTQKVVQKQGVLKCNLKRRYDGSDLFTVEKTIFIVDDSIAEVDAGICKALYDAGLCAHEDYVTKDEAALITQDDIQPSTALETSIFYSQQANIKAWNGFKYFTGITYIKKFFMGHNRLFDKLELPPSLIGWDASSSGIGAKHFVLSTPRGFDGQLGHVNSVTNNYRGDLVVELTDDVKDVTLVLVPNYTATEVLAPVVIVGGNQLEPTSSISVRANNVLNCMRIESERIKYIFDGYKNFAGIKISESLESYHVTLANDFRFLDGTSSKSITLIPMEGYPNFYTHDEILARPFVFTFSGAEGYYQAAGCNVWYENHAGEVITLARSTKHYLTARQGEDCVVNVGWDTSNPLLGVTWHYTRAPWASSSGIGYNINEPSSFAMSPEYDYISEFRITELSSIKIQHVDGSLYTKDEWVAGGFANEYANGVAIIRPVSTSFVVSKDILESTPWSSNEPTPVEECLTSSYTTHSDGFRLTRLWKESEQPANVELLAVNIALEYTFPNGKHGFLPSIEEGAFLRNNSALICELGEAIGASWDKSTSSVWTSSGRLYESGYFWIFSLKGTTTGLYKNGREILPFTTLD